MHGLADEDADETLHDLGNEVCRDQHAEKGYQNSQKFIKRIRSSRTKFALRPSIDSKKILKDNRLPDHEKSDDDNNETKKNAPDHTTCIIAEW